MFTLQEIATICQGQLFASNPSQYVQHFVTDSRQTIAPQSLFIALKGQHFNGHQFLPEVQGEQLAFLISEPESLPKGKPVILVKDTLLAFQQIAAAHRRQYHLPIVGITGSNGKTIVKEWLFQLLSPNFYVVKSPKSYNSQVGVPLSVLQINENHNLGIFEAGISKPNEMASLEKVIQPTIGILTNIGDAHAEGFQNKQQKLQEKLILFTHCHTIICQEVDWIVAEIKSHYPNKQIITWSGNRQSIICGSQEIEIPTKQDPFFVNNIGHCVALMMHLGISKQEIKTRIVELQTLPMRLEVVNGQNGNILLNDSYSNDLSGLAVCLEHAQKIAPNKPISLVLSSFQESGLPEEELKTKLAELIFSQKVDFLVLIGEFYEKNREFFADLGINASFFTTTKQALREFDWYGLNHQVVVVKGARVDRLEQIVEALKEKTHQTVWEINLSNLIENLNYYKSRLNENTKLLVMVKATAYGTESGKIAQILQQQRVDYLGVAYPDEGVTLRNTGITLPILVMNCSAAHFELAYKNQLEVQVYSLPHLRQLLTFCQVNDIEKFPIHIKLETGMNRLGFAAEDLPKLLDLLQQNEELLDVRGILSHLAAADDQSQLEFTRNQISRYEEMLSQLLPSLPNQPICHILNSSGFVIGNLPQFDMVRLGIGLHGISANPKVQEHIKQVGRLIARVSQVKNVKKGESVGYGRQFVAEKDTTVAIISAGYADGYDRRFSCGVGEVILHGKRCKTVGNVCMDMTMIDVSHLAEVKAGDEVILTNEELTVADLAEKIGTIPYELMTTISTRVERRFIYE